MDKLIKTKTKLTIFLLITSVLSCSSKLNIEQSDTLNTYLFKQDNIERSFILHLPSDYNKSKKYSLCFIFHGGSGNANLMVDKQYTQKADKLDFIMVYPNGIDGKWDFKGKKDGILNDIEFISTLLDYLKSEYSIDNKRVYASGVSMGGVMAYSLAANIPDKLSAITAVSSTGIGLNKTTKLKPVSVLHLHAKNDLVIPYRKTGYGALYSVNKWRESNSSEEESEVLLNKNGIYGEQWVSNTTGKTTSLITYETGGHGALPYTVDLTLDFFYNNPPRENRISFNIDSVKDHYIVGSEIKIGVEIDNLKNLNKVIYLLDGTEVENQSDNSEIFKWIPNKEGKYKLNAYGILNNGNRIHSAITLDILVIKPFKIGDYQIKASSIENRSLQVTNLIDGDLSTRWASQYTDDQEVFIDLNETKDINALSIIWEDAYAKSYFIELSIDGENWLSRHVLKEDNAPDFINFDKFECRYIKIKGDKRATSWGYSIYEILIH